MSSKHTSSLWKFQLIMKEMILINSFDLEILFGVFKSQIPEIGRPTMEVI